MEPDHRLRKAEEDLPNLSAPDDVCVQIIEKMAGRRLIDLVNSNANRICLEMLKLAVLDITGTSAQARKNRDGAREWVALDQDEWLYCLAPDVCSFEGCCEQLRIDPASARRFLLDYPVPADRTRTPRRSKAVIVPTGTAAPAAVAPPAAPAVGRPRRHAMAA